MQAPRRGLTINKSLIDRSRWLLGCDFVPPIQMIVKQQWQHATGYYTIRRKNDLHGHAIAPDRSLKIDISRIPTKNKIIFSTVVKCLHAGSKHYPYIQEGHKVGGVIGWVNHTSISSHCWRGCQCSIYSAVITFNNDVIGLPNDWRSRTCAFTAKT